MEWVLIIVVSFSTGAESHKVHGFETIEHCEQARQDVEALASSGVIIKAACI